MEPRLGLGGGLFEYAQTGFDIVAAAEHCRGGPYSIERQMVGQEILDALGL
jgi:hypothetical protein